MKKSQIPWASGPAEILKHAFSLLQEDSDTNRRLAMLLVDNAVEQMAKTYLSLPKRITGLNISRKQLQEIFESFPALLDALEEHAADKLEGVDIGSIEWYHRLRNELYHQGIGLTVERDKVEIYGELANVLFKNLFGASLEVIVSDKAELLGRFIELWNRLEAGLVETASETKMVHGMRRTRFTDAARFLVDKGVMPQRTYLEIVRLREIRNAVVHGQVDYKATLTTDLIRSLSELVKQYPSRNEAVSRGASG